MSGGVVGILGTLLTACAGVITFFVKTWLSDMKDEIRAQRVDFVREVRGLRLEVSENTKVVIVAMLKMSDMVQEHRELLEQVKNGIDSRQKREEQRESEA